jgi:hypothetical protein
MLISNEVVSEAILGFERCGKYYRGSTEEAQKWRARLALSIRRCCEIYNIEPAVLVQRCIENFQDVPDDYQLIEAAKGIHGPEPWRQSRPSKCGSCHGSRWKISYFLHTREGEGEFAFLRKQAVSKAVHKRLLTQKLERGKQGLVAGAAQCNCETEAQEREWTAAERQAHDSRWSQFCDDAENSRIVAGKQKLAKNLASVLNRKFENENNLSRIIGGYGGAQ